MTPFQFVFAFISIVTSLALTQLITGVVNLIRFADRRTITLTYVAWVALAFVIVIGNWAAIYAAQIRPDWPPQRILLWLMTMISLYGFCALLMPVASDRPVDVADFERSERRRYIIAHLVFTVSALLLIFLRLGFSAMAAELAVAPGIALVLTGLALLGRKRWQQQALALLLLVNATAMTLAMLVRVQG